MTLAILAAIALNSVVLSQTQVHAQHALLTTWGKNLKADSVWPEYPRPMMVRKHWINLNGRWDFSITNGSREIAKVREILVPFPPESQLSGVQQEIAASDTLTYHRKFRRPNGDRVLLHFGASDWSTSVSINGKDVGSHKGGYDAFTFDITDALTSDGDQDLVVTVTDPTDSGTQPRGKQVHKPGGIFYTSTSGIWQTVWLEPVPRSYLSAIRTEVDAKAGLVRVQPSVVGGDAMTLTVDVLDGSKVVATATASSANELVAKVPSAKWWSPEHPFLYDLRVSLKDARGHEVDSVTSYCGFREIKLAKNSEGQPMVELNGKPVFLFGPLDQGFWPGGIYTPPSDEAMKHDIQVTKELGFNTIRKHVKVEPQRWYTWCDRMGILVMQDMPSGDGFIGPNDPDLHRTPESSEIYYRELEAMIDGLRNHPSIICWIPFNEGWGQFDTAKVTDWIRSHDPSRLIDSTTGWSDRGVGDFHDVHVYPGPGAPKPEMDRASILGEFGGLGLVVEGHTWQTNGWGYQSFKTRDELTDAFENLLFHLRLLKDSAGLSGAIYTQTTDVETELNGLMTYDRAMVKPDLERAKKAIASVYLPAPKFDVVLPTSELASQTWSMTTTRPADGWMNEGFDASGWTQAKGGFGTPETPGAVVGTRWDSSDIWLRKSFDLASPLQDAYLRIHHDDDVEVYLDGKLILAKPGWTTSYELDRIHIPIGAGKHTLAVYCHQKQGGQFIDVGIVRLAG